MNDHQSKQIERLYLQMYDMLMTYARANEESEELAEEAVQEAFRIACQEPEKLCGSPNPEGWVFLTLRNVIRNNRKQRARLRIFLEEYVAGQVKEAAFSVDQINVELLYQNVAGSEAFKILSEMIYEGKSHAEMARDRGISVNACKKKVQRAKEELKKKIEKDVTF